MKGSLTNSSTLFPSPSPTPLPPPPPPPPFFRPRTLYRQTGGVFRAVWRGGRMQHNARPRHTSLKVHAYMLCCAGIYAPSLLPFFFFFLNVWGQGLRIHYIQGFFECFESPRSTRAGTNSTGQQECKRNHRGLPIACY